MEFEQLWEGIKRTWIKSPHCMLHGCGRETFRHWYVNAHSNEYPMLASAPHWKVLRRALKEAVRRGLLHMESFPQRPRGHCTRYWPTDTAGLPHSTLPVRP